MLRRKKFLLLIFPILLEASYAENQITTLEPSLKIGIDERAGNSISRDLFFYDEHGNKVNLDAIINKPTILSLTYYSCSNLCDNISANVAALLGRMQGEPGKDYSVITVSFDEKDTPAAALQRKRNYIESIGRPFPDKAWRFLTGDLDGIIKLTDSVGFRFQRDSEGFKHPATLIVLSPRGKIIRYLYGTTYLPFDVLMALTEASIERTGPTIPKVLLFCYKYDPKSKRYIFNVMKGVALLTILSAATFFVYLTLLRKRM